MLCKLWAIWYHVCVSIGRRIVFSRVGRPLLSDVNNLPKVLFSLLDTVCFIFMNLSYLISVMLFLFLWTQFFTFLYKKEILCPFLGVLFPFQISIGVLKLSVRIRILSSWLTIQWKLFLFLAYMYQMKMYKLKNILLTTKIFLKK